MGLSIYTAVYSLIILIVMAKVNYMSPLRNLFNYLLFFTKFKGTVGYDYYWALTLFTAHLHFINITYATSG